MSQRLRESLLSYQFSKTERSRATSTSTDSPPSPGESLRSRSPQPARRARPQLRVRPHSSGERISEKIRVQTIEEGSDRGATQSAEQKAKAVPKSKSSESKEAQSFDDAVVSAARSVEKDEKIAGSQSPHLKPTETPTESITSREKTKRPSWARTRSGGVWYLNQKNTSSHDDSSIRSARSTVSKSNQDEPKSISVVPLKPPPRPERLQTSPTNHIVVEQPFGHDRDSNHLPESNSTTTLAADRRRSSIDVKRLFSAPFTILRRSLGDRFSRLPAPSPDRSSTSTSTNPIPPSANQLLSKRDQIATTLDRVSSLLETHTRSKFKARVRSLSHKTVSSTSSSDPNDSRQSRTKALVGTSYISRNKSLDHVVEVTSSILDVHMGSTPRNSPTEKATYKIKRRPSAETEEFLKIDISIRGGTSYLASEARRISTPPLPDDTNPNGMRRGFFFDYNAPNFDVCNEMHPGQQYLCSEDLDHHAHDSTVKPGIEKRTTADVHRSSSRKTAHKAKTGDWYDTQLASLDTASFDVNTTISSESQSNHRCKHDQFRLAEIRRQQYEAQLDYDIPEHLPNSPLCPRNPRYWRVRQQKGSQFRGCWMHGFREYHVVPGLMK